MAATRRKRCRRWWTWCAATSTKATAVAELRLTGRPASPGLALSRLFVLADAERAAVSRKAGDPEREAERLRAAIAAAIAELEQVVGQADDDARDILEFQVAMLGDDALSEAAF